MEKLNLSHEPEVLRGYQFDNLKLNEEDIFFSDDRGLGLYLIHLIDPMKGYNPQNIKLYHLSLTFNMGRIFQGDYKVESRLETTYIGGKYNYYLYVSARGEERLGVGKDGPIISYDYVYDLMKREVVESRNAEEVEQINRKNIIREWKQVVGFCRRVRQREAEQQAIENGDIVP